MTFLDYLMHNKEDDRYADNRKTFIRMLRAFIKIFRFSLRSYLKYIYIYSLATLIAAAVTNAFFFLIFLFLSSC